MCHVVEKEGGQTWSMVDSTGLEESVVDPTTPYLLHHLCNHSHKHGHTTHIHTHKCRACSARALSMDDYIAKA